MIRETFVLGEKRYVSFEIKSRTGNEDFKVYEASWELLKQGELEESGQCEIDSHIIYSLIQPRFAYNNYKLVVTYRIADQILKEVVDIEVIKP